MSRKLLGRAAAVFALTAGLVVLASQVMAGDQTTPVSVEPATTTVAANTDAGAVDMNNWQPTQTPGGASKFKIKR
jgi:hypothetical protein